MDVRFIASFSVVTGRPAENRRLFVEDLGLPLAGDGDYVYSEQVPGAKHFGVWPLDQAAQACFGSERWPQDRPIPQACVEFEVDDVEAAARELEQGGYRLLHPARTEPWNQTIARLQTDDGLLVGVCYTPWLRESSRD